MDTKDRIVLHQETDEDKVYSLSLRPPSLSEFVGQQEIVDNLKISVEAAKRRGEPVEHILLSGPPGLGKTTLANIVAHEMGARITITSGPAITRAGDFIGILTNLNEGDVLFIDEIHRLNKTVEEFLYPAMEQFKIDFIVDKGPYARSINFNLKPFTLVGATTRSGLLASPLRDRFGMFYHLDFYPVEDLLRIVMHSAEKLKTNIDLESGMEIARRARGTPRIANRLLRRVRDFASVKTSDGIVNLDIAQEAMKALGVDAHGLDELDRRMMKVMRDHYAGGPVGIEALAATLNEETDTLEDVVEPYLLKIGFLKRTPRGRELSQTAMEHLKKSNEKRVTDNG